MIERNKKILSLLTEAKKLIAEQHKEAGTNNDDTFHVNEAIELVQSRITYLEKQAATAPKAEGKTKGNKKAEAEAAAEQKKAAERAELYKSIYELHQDLSIEELTAAKAEAAKTLEGKADDVESQLVVEVCDVLIAEKQKTTETVPETTVEEK